MACVPVALRALRIFSSACVFSCVRCVFRCVKFLSLRILLRALRIRCVFFLSLRILLRRLRIRCVKFRSLRILLRALRILLRISLRNGLALRALRCVRRMEIGLKQVRYAVREALFCCASFTVQARHLYRTERLVWMACVQVTSVLVSNIFD